MNNNQLTPHEIIDLHELLNANLLGAKKISAGLMAVQDENLKTLMTDSLNGKKTKIQELQNFINNVTNLGNSNQCNQNNNNQQ
jgi:similar to spore coat protein